MIGTLIKIKDLCVKILRDTKIRYYEKNIDIDIGNSKLMWKHLKSLVGTKTRRTTFDRLWWNRSQR